MVSKNWKIINPTKDNLIDQLLLNRGIKTEKEIEKFFNPSLKDYPDLIKIPGIKNAFKRVQKAIDSQETIIVYGDYDVDGICASAILYKGLTSLGAKVLPYIPHREKEGYGLSNLGLEFARDSGATLVITVDNGIVALEQAKFAKEIGLDLIITDHHLPLDQLPDAFGIVHSTNMCGAGVAWCLIKDFINEDLSKDLLELVAIATIADLIPLVGIGRAFVFEGIKKLNKTKSIGLKALIQESGITQEIGAYEIGHIIGPRINAIGRLEHAIDALRLVCTKDPLKARKLAKILCDANLQRQQLTALAIEEAEVLIKNNGTKKIHILDSKNWVPGIIGLVAARICQEHYVPAIALSVGPTHAKGSARSTDGINIVEVIRSCSDILVDVGGHKGAAGFTIANTNLEVFKKRVEKYIDTLEGTQGEAVLEIEAEVEKKMLTKALTKKLEEFEPTGFGNPKPLLVTKNFILDEVRVVGEGGKHLKLKVEGIDAIAFGMGQWAQILKKGQFVDLAYCLEINKFNGSEILQLKVKDLKVSNT